MLGQPLQNSARDSESSLGGLVRIGRGSDDNRLALKELEVAVASEAEGAGEDLRCVPLHEDIVLEGEPGRQPVVRVAEGVGHFFVAGGALHYVAVGVAGVAVGAAEGAANVGIDGPES